MMKKITHKVTHLHGAFQDYAIQKSSQIDSSFSESGEEMVSLVWFGFL
jgi:hypothetical protein